ncbi:MAG: AAA family ATPase [Puniceicoccaceae bacterium]
MKIKNISLRKFKRFENFTIKDIPQSARLIILTGPNGSGKSSLFEGFNFWSRFNSGYGGYDPEYHSRDKSIQEHEQRQTTRIEFHDFSQSHNHLENKGVFYIRSAYRHEADFTTSNIGSVQDALESASLLQSLIRQESRVSENYNRIVGEAVKELFNGVEPDKTKLEIRDRLIGQIRESMEAIFGDLILSGTGNPTNGGTFRFNKGAVSHFHYKNLSGGEKAAFDLLLDFIVKKEAFNNTVFCIDEPELHMHTKLQGKLLEQLFHLLPENCQLWISTHSIGMARKAAELYRENPQEVIFLDFHGLNFDEEIALTPLEPSRDYWKNMFDTALDDLSKLVVPSKVVFCEGKRLGSGGRKPSFDVSIYSKIFGSIYPDCDFVPLGGTTEVESDGKLASALLKKLAPGITTWMVFDRDDRSSEEIVELESKDIRVLGKRDLESYLWSDEILQKLATSFGQDEAGASIIEEKNRLLANLPSNKPRDDIKAISGELYNFCKETLLITQRGNNAEAFSRDALAPLITPDTSTFQELDSVIFGQQN